jgi:menaquinol-cytochrome c reductase iron-sulfur subunit
VEPNRDQHDGPGPSLWPIGFALGVVCGLAGLILSSWIVVTVGAVIAVLAAAAWIRESTSGYEAAPPEAPAGGEPAASSAVVAPVVTAGNGDGATGEPATPVMSDEEIERFPRSVFLEGTTIGLGAVIAGIVTVPVVGFMVAPPFVKQSPEDADVGPISNFPEGHFVITTFFRDPAKGDVTRRTAFIRNNGVVDGKPSFTVISNRCAHLGCPVQANGPVFDKQKKTVKTPSGGEVTLIPAQPAGFGCPCHGGQYDTEGNRTAGPPVRALDRYSFAIHTGHLVLLGGYSVSKVDGQGAAAIIHAYNLTGPGQHVSGPERFLYPWQPPH